MVFFCGEKKAGILVRRITGWGKPVSAQSSRLSQRPATATRFVEPCSLQQSAARLAGCRLDFQAEPRCSRRCSDSMGDVLLVPYCLPIPCAEKEHSAPPALLRDANRHHRKALSRRGTSTRARVDIVGTWHHLLRPRGRLRCFLRREHWMTLLFRRRIRVDRHLRIDDRWSHHGIGMRHGLWLFEYAGVARTRFDLRWTGRSILGRRPRW
jgi:hypothetical protein